MCVRKRDSGRRRRRHTDRDVKRFWKWLGTIALIGLVAVLFLPVFGRTAVRGLQTWDLSNAKSLGIASTLYLDDHEGNFPTHLLELVPDYIDAQNWSRLLYAAHKDKEEKPVPQFDWLYFGAFFDDKNPPPMLIASPQAFTEEKANKRIVVLANSSASIVSEEEYQDLLRKTIKAMRQRAGTLAVPALEAERQ